MSGASAGASPNSRIHRDHQDKRRGEPVFYVIRTASEPPHSLSTLDRDRAFGAGISTRKGSPDGALTLLVR